MNEAPAVNILLPGRKTKRALKCVLVLALVFVVVSSSTFPYLPNIVNTFFPWVSSSASSTSKTGKGSNSQVQTGPGTSLPPGSLGTESAAQPSFSQVTDGSVPPHVIATSSAFSYQTSYGTYSFDRSAPFIFSLQTSSGAILSKGSFFFVRTGQAPLTPGLSTVLVASDTQYVTRYEVLLNKLVVGYLQLQVDFQASSRPKFSIQFSQTSNWTLGHFNIVWATFTADQWARPSGRPPLAISTLSSVQQFSGSSRVDIGPSGDPSTWTDWLTTDWSDAPGGVLETGPLVLAGLRGTGHDIVFPADQATIDPTQVTTSNVNTATGYSTQRKLAYYAGRYYMFYYSGSSIQMKSSTDQVTWTAGFVEGGGTCWGGAIGYNFDLAQSGSTIALVWLYYNSSSTGDHTTALYFKPGVIFDGDISWGSCVKVASFVSQPYSWPPSVTIGSDGTYWVGGIWNDANLNYNVWIYKSADGSAFSLSTNYLTSNSASRYEALQLIPLTTGRVMSLTSHYSDAAVRWRIWNPLATNGGSWSSTQSLSMNFQTNTPKWSLMSATSTPDGNVHMIFEQFTTTYQIVYSFYNSTTAQWTVGPSLYNCSSQCLYPTISSDSLGNLYGFWMALSAGVPTYLIYSTKIKGQSWSATSQPFGSGTNIQNANWLSSSRTSTKEVLLAWTLNTTSPYKIFLGTIPLSSGIASGPPLRPWSRIGLATNEQYFTQNGEYLSPGNGLLTVSQTDISVQGRNGLSLAITRVYVQPFTLLQGSPINYETTPYANLGYGWQLNLPWVGSQYLHFLNAEMFPIVYANSTNTTNSTYSVTVWSFENHQTEDFLFARTNTTNLSSHTSTITFRLTTKDGAVYNFNNIGAITSLADRTGQNQISFSYTGTLLSSITDTVGRTATLKYNGGNQLANVTYGGQTVRYGYSGSNLVTVTDAAGRVITLKYNGASAWLLTGVVYTAGGNSTYTYGSIPVGTDAINYYVILQNVDNPGTIVKTSSFSYNITDGEVTSTVVKQSDGFNVQGFTNYVFNAKANSLTRTVLNGTQVQMLKTQFWLDPLTGRSAQQDIFTGTSIARNFYNSQFYDNWGNVIYTRDNTGHESYQSFANTNTQWTLQSPGSMSTTTNGRVFYDDFNGPTLNTTAWATGGSGTQLVRTVTGSLLKLQLASSTQGTTQSNWVRSSATYGYPFYAEVQMMKGAGDGTGSAEFILSPQQTGSTGNPFQNNDALRLLVTDGPTYEVLKIVGGVTTTVWSSGNRGTHSLDWKIILTDRNTLKVWVNLGLSQGYQELYSTTSLGLSTSFTPSYAYLVFENPSTTTYSGTFDYVGLSSSNTVTLTNLQANQKVDAYDWNNVLQSSGTVASGQTSLSLNLTQFPFPYGYFKIYELDGRAVQFTSATREIWGGSTYAYNSPFRSGGDQRTSTGFLQNSSKYVDESLPTGAVTYSDGGDSWVWATGLVVPTIGDEAPSLESVHVSQIVAGTHEHYFNTSSQVLAATSGYYLIQYVYIPSTAVPGEIMLQFHTQGGTWEHRAYWGSNLIAACGTTGATCGTNGTPSRLPMGALPTVRNAWIELIVKTDDVGVNGLNVDGWAYTLYNGGAYWDESDLASSSIQTVTMNNLLVGQKVELYNSTGTLKTSATVASGQTSVTLNVYSVGINTFPYTGYVKVYGTTTSLQYYGPPMRDVWGGDVYSYNQPVFSNNFNPSTGIAFVTSVVVAGANSNAATTASMAFTKGDLIVVYVSVGAGQTVTSITDSGSPSSTYTQRVSAVNGNTITYLYTATAGTSTSNTITVKISASGNFAISAAEYSGAIGFGASHTSTGTSTAPSVSLTTQTSNSWVLVGFGWTGAGTHSGDIGFVDRHGGSSNTQHLDYGDTNAAETVGTYSYSATLTESDAWAMIALEITMTNPPPASSIHNLRLGTAQYQNATSTPEQDYANYDILGNMLQDSQIHNGSPLTTTYTFDSYGNQASIINPDNEKTYNTYSTTYQHAYLTNTTRVLTSNLNVTTNNVYNFTTGMQITSFDSVGNRTDFAFDQITRPVMIQHEAINASRTDMSFHFEDAADSFGIENEKGNYTDFHFDGQGRITTVQKYSGQLDASPVLATDNFTYDWQNKEKTHTAPNGNVTSYQYDYLGRLVKVTNPDGTIRTTSYDGINLIQSDYDENGHRIDTIYDSMGRTIGIREYYSQAAYYSTSYIYNGVGNLAKSTDGKSQTTTYTYDDLGRLTLTVYPDGFNDTRTYDSIGNLIGKKDPNGNTIAYSYDNFNRLINETYPDGSKATFSYDTKGNVLSLSYKGNSATFVYDSRNRETSETWTISGSQYTLRYAYDGVGNLVSTTYPDGTVVKYSIDPLNRVANVTSGGNTLATFTYSNTSMVSKIVYGNGVQTSYTYDRLNRPSRIKIIQSSTTLLDLNYTFDAVGNVASINTESYSYDFLNRQTVAAGAWGTVKYGYDGVGNRLWFYKSPTNTTYGYGAYDRLSSVGSTSYTYDNNGNQKTQTTGSTTTSYFYDFDNRLTSVARSSSTLGNYTYSAQGTRVQKIETGVTTVYLNRGFSVLYEKQTVGGSTTNDYVYIGSRLVAKLSGGSTYYFHQDALGSTRLVTTGSTTSFSSNYQPFGPQYASSGTDPTYKYTDKPQDASSGLYYFGARYYNTTVGRFLSRDPAQSKTNDAQSLNPYAYARNNPEKLTDPTGAYWISEWNEWGWRCVSWFWGMCTFSLPYWTIHISGGDSGIYFQATQGIIGGFNSLLIWLASWVSSINMDAFWAGVAAGVILVIAAIVALYAYRASIWMGMFVAGVIVGFGAFVAAKAFRNSTNDWGARWGFFLGLAAPLIVFAALLLGANNLGYIIQSPPAPSSSLERWAIGWAIYALGWGLFWVLGMYDALSRNVVFWSDISGILAAFGALILQ